MSKYIIKNCPACYLYGNKYGCEDNHDEQGRDTYCELIDDCVMKQIVERCKKVREGTANICTNPYEYATYCETGGVLELLDIQEVE